MVGSWTARILFGIDATSASAVVRLIPGDGPIISGGLYILEKPFYHEAAKPRSTTGWLTALVQRCWRTPIPPINSPEIGGIGG